MYVELSGFQSADEIALGFCSISQGTSPVPVVADPNCASSIAAPLNCVPTGGQNSCPPTASPAQWQYAVPESSQFTLSIGTEFDPPGGGDSPIVSQNSSQLLPGLYGSFYCDNGPDFCGLEVMEIPPVDQLPNLPHQQGLAPSSSFVPSSQNTLIIPVSWQSGTAGCGSAPIVQADASYSAQQFLTAAAESTCSGPGGDVVLPTEEPSVDQSGCVKGTAVQCPVTDVADGTVPVTFTDDPEDPLNLKDEKLKGGKFAYIPIAVSATEVAFYGSAGQPVDSYELTPAMAAGVMTQLWEFTTSPGSGEPEDDLCGQLSGTAHCREAEQTGTADPLIATRSGNEHVQFEFYQYLGNDDYSNETSAGEASDFYADTSYALLNPWVAKIGNESDLGAVFSSTASGASYAVTSWMCSQPNVAYSVVLPWDTSQPATVNDLMSAAQILVDAEQGPLEVTKNASGELTASNTVTQGFLFPPSQCSPESKIPDDFADTQQTQAGFYEPSSSPLTQAHAMQGAVNSDYYGKGGVAFGAMDSSQADFLGLLPASLENAAGQFVAPTQASVDAAVADAKTSKDGTLTPDYDDTTDAAAYPLPMVTYALVSTAAQPTTADAEQLKAMLTNLVGYSYAGGVGYSVPMPAGYYPLPASLYQQAMTDIAKDVVSPGSTGPTGNTSPPATAATPGGATTTQAGNAAPASGASSSPSVGRIVSTLGSPLQLTLGAGRFALPVLLGLAILCLICGPILYVFPSVRRRLVAAGGGPWRHRGSTPAQDG